MSNSPFLSTSSRPRNNSSFRGKLIAAALGTCFGWFLSATRTLSTSTRTRVLSPHENNNKGSSSLAYHDSLGFYDDVLNADWQRQRDRVLSEGLFYNVSDPNQYAQGNGAMWMLHNVDPLLTCPHMRRVGGRGDGPKWVCDPHRLAKYSDCLVYSIGSNGNYMFEDGLAEIFGQNHCEIHVFDPDPAFEREGDKQRRNIHYHAWGLTSSYVTTPRYSGLAEDAQFYSLAETMRKLGHTGRRIDIFKIDCEGCEWISYQDWISESVDIRQLQIEIHASAAKTYNVTLSGFFQAIYDRGFVPFAKEANTHPNARPLGSMFEYAFLRLHPSFFRARDEVSTW